ncbi:MAG: zinc ribbon domain-containing protein [Lachnospiraceae bacterium]|nr:zinc ribbon domain-containing protein [Lachnospiraceae bacterium]
MICERCGTGNPDFAAVCEQCGALLPKQEPTTEKKRRSILDPLGRKKIRCSYCWYENRFGRKTCAQCGMPLSYVPYPEREGEGEEYVEQEELAERERESAEMRSAVEEAIAEELDKPETNPVPEGMIRCRNCWRDNPDTAAFCEYCDQKLDRPRKKPGSGDGEPAETVVCRVCGRRNDADEKVCYYCGESLYRAPIQEENEYSKLFSGTITAFQKAHALDLLEEQRKREEEQEKIERSKHRGPVNYAVPGKKRCRSCWYDNPLRAERCEKCGASLGGKAPGRGKSIIDK